VLALFGTDIILSRLTSDDQGSAYGRIGLAQTALAIIKDHPWVGIGLNNYMLVSPQYYARALAPQIPFVVHNAFLLIAAETGLVGLMAFLCLLASLLLRAWQIIDQAPNDTVWIAGVGIFCGFIALGLHSMTDYALLGSPQVFTQFWLLGGLAAALRQRIDCEQQAPPNL
jgi:putative inorganic carbon (HCO3(-)) transporter